MTTIKLNYQNRFDEIYNKSFDIESWSCYPVPKEIINFIELLLSKGVLKKRTPILDVGCGRGRLLIELEKLGFTNTTGIDVSDTAVKHAQSTAKKSLILIKDILNDPTFLQNSFGVIVDLTMICSLHPNYWPKIYQEINRLLVEDGYVISEMFIRPTNISLTQSLTKKSKIIPDDLDQIFGITEGEIDSVFGKYFRVIKYCKSFPDSIGRYYILAKKL